MNKKQYREVVYYKDYFQKFYSTLDKKVKLKLNWTIDLIESLERVPRKYFEHLTDAKGLYEIRVEYMSNIYRVFSFFDEDNLVIAINGFQKKTEKTPRKEIARALSIKKEYFDEKKAKQLEIIPPTFE